MFKAEKWQSHEDYMAFVIRMDQERRALTGESLFRSATEKLIAIQMSYLNLDRIKGLFLSLFSSDQGRPSKGQLVLRSLFLYMICLGRTGNAFSLEDWVQELKAKKELYVLIGCSTPDEVPEASTHYDLLDRFWAGETERYKRSATYDARMNCRKTKMKIGEDNKILDPDYKGDELAKRYVGDTPLGRNYERIAQQMLAFLGVYPSMENGCIPKVICAGFDTTALAEHGSQFGTCACGRQRMFCPYRGVCGMSAHFSAVDGSIGFDSGTDSKFHGQHVCIISCTNPVTHTDLPLSYTFVDANRHDSVTIYVALQEFHRNVSGAHISYALGDKAYGNNTLANVLLGEGTIPLFDLPSNRRNPSSLPKEVVLNGDTVPCCEGGVQMTLLRNDEKTQCWVYGCPLKSGERKKCPMADKCAVKDVEIIINPKEDPNIFPVIPREDEKYRKIYNLRSGNERVNDRLLNDYHLADICTRNVNHRSFFAAIGCILLHLDAWYKMSIIPEGEHAAAFFKRMDAEIQEILQKKAPKKFPAPVPGTKVNTKEIMDMLITRNMNEKRDDSKRFERARDFREAVEKELKGQPAWRCPKEAYEESKKRGENPLDNPPAPIVITAKLPIDWYEDLFVKKWERTEVPYIPPTVVLDPEGLVTTPSISDYFSFAEEGFWKNFSVYDPERAKELRKNPVVGDFKRVREDAWRRESPVIVTVLEREESPPSPSSKLSKFVDYEFTPENCHSPNYAPPPIAGIEWDKATRATPQDLPETGHNDPGESAMDGAGILNGKAPGVSAGSGDRPTPKLERDERYRSQPLPYEHARSKLKRYERSNSRFRPA